MEIPVVEKGPSKTVIFAFAILLIITISSLTLLFLDPFSPPNGNTTTTTTETTTTTSSPNPYDVAIVFATGGLGDRGMNDATYNGAVDAYNSLDIEFTYAEPETITTYETIIRGYAAHSSYDDPYSLIICVGFDMDSALMAVAEDYPDQQFAIVYGFIEPTSYPNVASLLFDEHEGAALVGAIAGLMTTQNEVGFIGGIDIPLINKYAAGFVFGANYTNPGIGYSISYTNDWVDTSVAKTLADIMYSSGTDIVFTASGRAGLGVFDSCKEQNESSSYPLWVIGSDYKQMYLGCSDVDNPASPTVSPTSMLKRIDVAVYSIISDVVEGTFSGGIKIFNLSSGGLDYEINEALFSLPPAIVTIVEAFRVDIIDGTIIIPDVIYWS